jgi:uncharacterized protein involved in outer membrane biogenesis
MRWKWILSIAATLMIALIVTVYAILSSYNFNNLKPTISQAVKDITGRELTLGGDCGGGGELPKCAVEFKTRVGQD